MVKSHHSSNPKGRIRSYRFGFNGQLKDNEMYGEGNAYGFEARMYDPRIGRWMAMDPLAGKYPFVSPYQFSNNSPIYLKDPNGKEWINPYEEAIDREMQLKNPDMDKVAVLMRYANEVNNIINDIAVNDPELFSYIENTKFGRYNENTRVIVYTSFKEANEATGYGGTGYEAIPGNNDNYLIKSREVYDVNVITGKEELGEAGLPKAGQNNTFNIVLYRNSRNPQDITLANEAGDVMNGIENPAEVWQQSAEDPEYDRAKSTHYSYNVEEVYSERKAGNESKSTDVYPLKGVADDKSSQTQDNRTVKRNEGVK